MKHLPLISIGIFIAALLLLTGTAGAAPPIAAFSATPTSGIVPLTVTFTDASTGFLPGSGRAWFFGDETYTQPWTQMNASAGWLARDGHTSVTMPDGSIVLMGGWGGGLKNDVWRSTDNGATWTQMTAIAGWSARYLHTSVVMDGSIVLMGGDDGSRKNDVWRSTDDGATWTQLPDVGWSARDGHTSVTMPDGSIVLMGGNDGGLKNDVWRSTDNGATWTRVTASADWSARYMHTSVAMPDGSIVLMGGNDGGLKNDVWRSTDNGASWVQVNASAGWSGRKSHTSVVMPDGSIVLMGGNDGGLKNDVWRSTDNGASWTQLPDAGWSARYMHTSVAMPDGSIVLMGGRDSDNKNDVWRFLPVGSSLQNPSHTYTVAGTYPVALQAYDTEGYNSTRKTGYITVMTLAAFSGTPTSGTAPLTVQFTDETTCPLIAWNWSFGDGIYSNSQNPLHTYLGPGFYTVILNATNTTPASNYLTKTRYISVSVPPPDSAPDGGSDGGPAPEQVPDQPTTIDVNVGGDSAVTQVVVTGTGISDLIVTGRVVSGPGNGVSSPPGLVYEFVEISPARYGTITGAQIFFTVPQSWLDANQLTPQAVVLEHNVGSGWEPLTTTPLLNENGPAEFFGTSPGFSRFAITGQPGISPVTTVTTSSEMGQTFGDLQPAPGAGSPITPAPPVASEPVVVQTTALPVPQPAPVFPVAALVIIAGIVLVGSGFLIRRWWIRKQNPALFRIYD